VSDVPRPNQLRNDVDDLYDEVGELRDEVGKLRASVDDVNDRLRKLETEMRGGRKRRARIPLKAALAGVTIIRAGADEDSPVLFDYH
jgi:predicted nuclease with TOPRIM domain